MRKNINPKTLKGQDKLNRITDLMGRMSTLNESKSFSELELIKKGPNGVVYGIIRENHDYFIKTSNKSSGQFLAEDFNYVGGLHNKYDERYKSYAEAIKHLNMKFDMLNESYNIDSNTNIFETDGVAFGGGTGFGFVMEEDEVEDEEGDETEVEGEKEIISDSDDELEEEKKVLKVDVPKSDVPMEVPVEDEVDVDMGGDIADVDFGKESEEGSDEFNMGGDEDETTKKIQKYTGKIGQMLRDMDSADPDLEKYVINSVISAMHLDEMDDEDKEDIISKLEGDEDEEGGDSFDMDSDVVDVDLDTEETPIDGGEELSEGKEGKGKELEITPDMIAMLLKDGECECSGQKLVYKPKENKKEETNEGRIFSKKQLLESFLRKSTKKSLKRVLKERREICEECMGEGCPTCMEEHHMGSKATYDKYPHYDKEAYVLDEDEEMNEKLKGRQHKLDVAPPRGRLTRADFDKLRSDRSESRRDRRRHIDEEDLSVMDAIATGQGYLEASGDLDRDFDGIPNRLDMDNNDDGELDFSMGRDKYSNEKEGSEDFIELDIDFLRNSDTGTKEKERTITTPTTRPGKGDKWKTIKRPKVDPRPKARGTEGSPNMDNPRPSYRRRGMFR
jgi:hypothetical protein